MNKRKSFLGRGLPRMLCLLLERELHCLVKTFHMSSSSIVGVGVDSKASDVSFNLERPSQRLFDASEGTWTSNMHLEATHLIQKFTSSSSFMNCFQLLDRLVLKESSSLDKGELAGIVNLVVSAWQKYEETATILHPREVFDRLEAYRTQSNLQWTSPKIYTRVLDVAIKRKDVKLDAELLEDLSAVVESAMCADLVFYGTLMNGLAQLGDVVKAELLLKKLKALDMLSNQAYVHLITAHANAENPDPHRAEDLFEEMNNQSNNNYQIYPTNEAFGALLNVWAKSDSPYAGERAHSILKSMIEAKHRHIQINTVMYTSVIDAYSKQGQAFQAEQVLHELIQKYEATYDADLEPTVVSFSVVIDAWAKSRHPEAAIRAEAILGRMQALALSTDKYPNVAPNAVSFNGVLHAWAASQTQDQKAPERAEAVLHQMQYLYEQSGKDKSLKPNRFSMAIIMDCWSKSRDPRAASRVEAILDRMIELYRDGDADMKPDIVCFTTVMNALTNQRPAHNNTVCIPKKVHALMDRMRNEFEIEPNIYVFAIAIHAWVRHTSSPIEAVQPAEQLFRTAHLEYHEKGNVACRPNVIIYNSLMNAYAKAGIGHKAQGLLDLMEADDNVEVKPNGITYNSAISAWSKTAGGMNKAEALLDRMRCHPSISPDAVSYGAVMSALARSSHCSPLPICERALAYLDELKQLYRSGDRKCKPSCVTYSTAINILSQPRNGDKDAKANQVLHLLEEMKEFDAKPNAITYGHALSALSRSTNRAPTAFAMWKEMKRQKLAVSEKFHVVPLLNTCLRTKDTDDSKRDAFEIAKQVFAQTERPGSFTYERMILIAANGSDASFVKELYGQCTQRGFSSDEGVRRAIQKVAPNLANH